MRARRLAAVSTVALVVLVAGACGNAGSDGESAGDSETSRGGGNPPGVTDTEIRVGGVASVTNATGNPIGSVFDGAQAYFEWVNEQGGVFGRQIKLVAERDDQMTASRNLAQARALVEEDRVFAVVPVATLQFTSAEYLADRGVPTFGWNINAEWQGPPTLFGQRGSSTCFDCATPSLPWLAQQAGIENVGVIAYTAPQSRNCAAGFKNSFEKYGPNFAFEDTSVPFGNVDYSVDLKKMRDADIGLVATCFDGNGAANLARAIHDAPGLDTVLYLPNGYDHDLAQDQATVLEGSYVGALFVPFEAQGNNEALDLFLERMEMAGKSPNELAIIGWISADMFVTGLRAAGEDFTRESLVEALNTITDYDAGGIIPPVDWTSAHDSVSDEACTAFLQVLDGAFELVSDDPSRPFVCFPTGTDTLPEPTFR